MNSTKHALTTSKCPTGILGFDEMTSGGLPRGRTILLVGGRGSGKTIFARQFLVHGARDCKEPGIFVAFGRKRMHELRGADVVLPRRK